MKVTFDCTPEEARRFMGLPDLASVHEAYVEKLREAVVKGMAPDALLQTMNGWAPMSEAGAELWKTMIAGFAGSTCPK